jgi:hypothetical protein
MSNADKLAAAWIALTLTPEDDQTDEMFDNGFELNNHLFDNPEFAWEVILKIIQQSNFYKKNHINNEKNEIILSNLGAGPLETLLSHHGNDFIERIERLAEGSKSLRFALNNTWKSDITDQIWSRVLEARSR